MNDGVRLEGLLHLPPLSEMTEEDWQRHDARIDALRKAETIADAGRERRLRRDRLVAADWPSRALENAVTADMTKPAIEIIDAWDPQSRCVLVLSGAPGCGKSTAAAWWALRRADVTVFVRATTFAAGSRYDRETRARWYGARALVLDDLGSEYADAKGSFLVDLDELIDRFYAERRPLIITTNVTAKEFSARYGARIVDRLREAGRWQNIGGASLRKPGAP